MKVLIVDDEVFTVRAIKSSLDWERLGISEVFTVYNAVKAKEIIADNEIDIMICDIEMPQEDGMQLFSWVRENQYKPETVFLTCHSEFKYAQQAIKLGAFDYCVKPVDFNELEKVIEKAKDKILKDNQLEIKNKLGDYWIENQELIKQQFWHNLLILKSKEKPEKIEQKAHNLNLNFDKDDQFQIVLISVKKIKMLLDDWQEDMLLYALQNIAKEILLIDLESNRTVLTGGKLVVIFKKDEITDIKGQCLQYAQICEKHLNISIVCYLSGRVFCEEIYDAYKTLVVIEKNDILCSEKIVALDEITHNVDNSEINIPNSWNELLNFQQKDKLMHEIRFFLDRLQKNNQMNLQTLKKIQQDLLQMIFIYLQIRNVQAHKIYMDDNENSFNSVNEMYVWIDKTIDLMYEVSREDSAGAYDQIISKIKLYILNHLCEDIRREDIAKTVNLSLDYMARIFKNETGYTVNEYIISKKMEKAFQLLKTTNDSVSEIAQKVGYDNFSYFSKQFKKYTGYTPRECKYKSAAD